MDIQNYKTFLKNQYLIPSRQILHENMDANFKIFENYGLKNLSDLKQAISTPAKIDKLSKETKILPEYLNILRRELGTFDKTGTGLERINGIGPQAAKAFYEAGYKTVKDVANSTKEELLEKITKVNNEKQYYKAKLGLKDMQFVIDYANLIVHFES
ncbi:MAG: helix-hairpin-helix domain-containing protein [Bacteroidales bacterium]|nr:helix-hairpin-helix domain-containing protein [Bacteroidales bacterium]